MDTTLPPTGTPGTMATESLTGRTTASPTATATTRATATAAGTRISSCTRTVPAGPIPTTTPSGGAGSGFTLEASASGVSLTWQGSAVQGYVMVRVSGSEVAVLPMSGALASSATSFADAFSLRGLTCYILLPVGGTPPAPTGNSDLLCLIANIHSSSGAPQTFSLSLNQSTTGTFRWAPPSGGGQGGYLLAGLDGTVTTLPPSNTGASAPVTSPACFVLVVTGGGRATGNSDVICGVPGFARL